MRKAPHFIAVEGPLRVGKTKLARALASHIRGRSILDPVDKPHVERLFQGLPGSALRVQMQFLFGRFSQLSGAGIGRSQLPVVTDYLFEKDKLHAYLNLEDDEIEVYDDYFRFFKRQLPDPDLAVYLKATAETLRERLSTSSTGLENKIPGAYLEGTVRAYDHFFERYTAADVLVVDTARTDIVSRPQDLQALLEEIGRPVTGTQFFLPLGT